VGALLGSRAGVVWVVLLAATALTWQLGEQSLGLGATVAGVLVVGIAAVKVRCVGRWFMELAEAPLPLRLVFDGWCLAVWVLLTGLYLAG